MELSVLQILIVSVIGLVFVFWLAFRGVKAQKCTMKLKDNNFAGEVGEAVTNLKKDQKGQVAIHGELWKAVAMNDISKGDEVVVINVKNLIVYVKKYNGE